MASGNLRHGQSAHQDGLLQSGTAPGDPIEATDLRVPAGVEEAFGRAGDPIEPPAPRVMPAVVEGALGRAPNLGVVEGETPQDRLRSFEAKMREFSALIDGLAGVFPDAGDRRCLKREFARLLMEQLAYATVRRVFGAGPLRDATRARGA